mmetsp:Transcript_39012/g.93913  ORF Transcript_39012/g.93913 Transcript_39012/m.93913 type:complete len:95 (-) Transcript_39012:1955-2239(-)
MPFHSSFTKRHDSDIFFSKVKWHAFAEMPTVNLSRNQNIQFLTLSFTNPGEHISLECHSLLCTSINVQQATSFDKATNMLNQSKALRGESPQRA